MAERKVRGIHEGIYQATARSYWVSPRLVGRIGLRRDAGRAAAWAICWTWWRRSRPTSPRWTATAPELPSIGVSGEIRVPPERRQEFLDDLQTTLQDLFTRYGGAEGDAFKLAVACYPKETDADD